MLRDTGCILVLHRQLQDVGKKYEQLSPDMPATDQFFQTPTVPLRRVAGPLRRTEAPRRRLDWHFRASQANTFVTLTHISAQLLWVQFIQHIWLDDTPFYNLRWDETWKYKYCLNSRVLRDQAKLSVSNRSITREVLSVTEDPNVRWWLRQTAMELHTEQSEIMLWRIWCGIRSGLANTSFVPATEDRGFLHDGE